MTFLNLRGNFMCALYDFTFMLLSVIAHDFESTVQDVETKGNPVILMTFSC